MKGPWGIHVTPAWNLIALNPYLRDLSKSGILSCGVQYESNGPICSDWVREGQLAEYRARGWASILSATPCDLWRFLRGRTLWIMGDSQSQDFFKALQCFLHECAIDIRVVCNMPKTPRMSGFLSERQQMQYHNQRLALSLKGIHGAAVSFARLLSQACVFACLAM